MEKHITLPLTEELAKTLHAGDTVYVTGTIYTSRDAGHKRSAKHWQEVRNFPLTPLTLPSIMWAPHRPNRARSSAPQALPPADVWMLMHRL